MQIRNTNIKTEPGMWRGWGAEWRCPSTLDTTKEVVILLSMFAQLTSLIVTIERWENFCKLNFGTGGRIQRITWCIGPYVGVDYNLTLCPLHSRLQHIYRSSPMTESTLTLCQSRLYSPVRNFAFGFKEIRYPLYFIIHNIHVVFT